MAAGATEEEYIGRTEGAGGIQRKRRRMALFSLRMGNKYTERRTRIKEEGSFSPVLLLPFHPLEK